MKLTHRIAFPLLAFLSAVCGLLALPASAADYPSRPIRLVVPFPAGATADLLGREFGHVLGERLKQPVVVDNRAGANGMLGAQFVARAPADGYTLLFITGHMLAVTPHLVREPGFDALNDFTPITIATRGPALVVVRADSPYRSVKDLIDAAKKSPGKIAYNTSGEGSPQHLMGEKFQSMAGVELLKVGYKGETPALQDLMGGRIDFAFGFVMGTMPFVRGGRLRVLAHTGDKQLAAFPDVAPLAEAGIPGFSEYTYAGYAVPKGTPAEIVQRLYDEARASLNGLRKSIEERGADL
ncbi:MAG: Bug family tripartite tricarboxylate transporter substrate binding protein, partial [Burkholderiales bacterium]